MNHVKKALLLTLLASVTYAQPVPSNRTRILMQNYDLAAVTSGNAVACAPSEEPVRVKITTSGSSTTTSALTTGTIPFAKAAVGDIIRAYIASTNPAVPGAETIRIITVVGSTNSVTVNSAWTLPTIGTDFTLIKRNCSAITATSPWVNITNNKMTQLAFSISTINATGGISFRIEGLFSDVNDVNPLVSNIWPGIVAADAKCFNGTFDGTANCNYSSTTGAMVVSLDDQLAPKAVRLVAFIVTADTGVNAINATLTEGK